MNLGRNIKITRVANSAAAGTSAVTCSTLDMAGFEGVLFIAAFGDLSNGAVTGIKAQQGQLANMGDAADLAGTAIAIADTDDNKVLALEVYRPRERYVRAIVTRGTANAVLDGVIAIQYGAAEAPTSHDSTVVGYECHVSPAEGTA